MWPKPIIFLCILFLSISCINIILVSAATETVIDNTEAASHGTRSDLYFTGATYYAQAFKMGSNSGTISSFIVQDAYINPWTSGYLFKIYNTTTSGAIGAAVLNFNSSVSQSSGLCTLTPSATYTLRANTTYWIVGAMSTGSNFYWKYKNTAYSGAGSIPSSYYRAKSTDSGSNYVYDGAVSSSVYGTSSWAFDFKLVITTTSTYALSYAAGAGGAISGTAAQYLLAGESGTQVTAVPDTGYSFSSWSDGSTSTSRTDANLSTSTTFTASFTPSTFNVIYAAGAGGTISGSSTQIISYNQNASSVTAVPDTGYSFSSWSDGSTSTSRTENNIVSNFNATATFAVDSYPVFYAAGTGGTISGSSTQVINHGSDTTAITAVPDTGYYFSSWSDGSTSNPRTDTNITATTTLTANFTANASTQTPPQPGTSAQAQVNALVAMGRLGQAKQIQKQYTNIVLPESNAKDSFTEKIDIGALVQYLLSVRTQIVSAPSTDLLFPRDLFLGIEGDDVRQLQQYLNSKGFYISDQGPGSVGNETRIFGALTRQALAKFQKDNNISPAHGYFGAKTKAFIGE